MTNVAAYRPTSGDEGRDFMDRFCDRCQEDAAFQAGTGDSCPIAAATLTFDVDDSEYPKEWIEDDVESGPSNPRCTAFKPI